MADYVLGYGSLMEFSSRSQTEPTAQGIYPIKVSGYQRGWFHQFTLPTPITTFLGVVRHKDATTNGVIYQVDNIAATDGREIGYTREPIYDQDLIPYDETHFPLKGKLLGPEAPDKLWIYVTNQPNHKRVDDAHPLVQSYIDICVNGCFQADYVLGNLTAKPFAEIKKDIHTYNAAQLEDLFFGAISTYQVQAKDIDRQEEPYQPTFSQEFLDLTTDWPVEENVPTAWNNDRVHPRRPFQVKNALRIDELLDSKWPKLVERIKIE